MFWWKLGLHNPRNVVTLSYHLFISFSIDVAVLWVPFVKENRSMIARALKLYQTVHFCTYKQLIKSLRWLYSVSCNFVLNAWKRKAINVEGSLHCAKEVKFIEEHLLLILSAANFCKIIYQPLSWWLIWTNIPNRRLLILRSVFSNIYFNKF